MRLPRYDWWMRLQKDRKARDLAAQAREHAKRLRKQADHAERIAAEAEKRKR